jgi:hypothetical protein
MSAQKRRAWANDPTRRPRTSFGSGITSLTPDNAPLRHGLCRTLSLPATIQDRISFDIAGSLIRHLAGLARAMVVMLMGIGFIAVLTATISSYFVKSDRSDEHVAPVEALARIEAELAELETRIG